VRRRLPAAAGADYEQWEHWWIGASSVKFSTEEAAAGYMRTAGHASNQYRTERGPITQMSINSVRRAWFAADKPPDIGDWLYGWAHLSGTFSSEAAMVAAIQEELEPAECEITQFDVDAEWAIWMATTTPRVGRTKASVR
jgi:hypothetical protein